VKIKKIIDRTKEMEGGFEDGIAGVRHRPQNEYTLVRLFTEMFAGYLDAEGKQEKRGRFSWAKEKVNGRIRISKMSGWEDICWQTSLNLEGDRIT